MINKLDKAGQIRCHSCGKLLATGTALALHIRCPRCKTDNFYQSKPLRAKSTNIEDVGSSFKDLTLEQTYKSTLSI